MAETEEIQETKIMRRIRSLIERAEHKDTKAEERKVCLEMADKLMFSHAIDRATINATKDTSSGIKKFEWEVPWQSEFSSFISDMMRKVAKHCRLKAASQYTQLTVVGYEEDIMYGQMLWNTIHLEFARRINPGWDSARTFDENVTLLKDSGKKWVEIANMAIDNGFHGSTTDGTWLRKAYARQCALEGREVKRHTQRHQAYRQSFAESFFATITRRLRDMQESEEDSITDRDRVLPALRTESAKVEEVFWEHFPNLHPDARAAQMEKWRREAEEERRKQQEIWDRMTPAQQEAEMRRQEREERKWQRRAGKLYVQVDDLGWATGDEVAKSVNLSPGKNDVAPNQMGVLE